MLREEGAIRLTAIMRDIFDEDDVEYSDSLTADDVEGWIALVGSGGRTARLHARFLVDASGRAASSQTAKVSCRGPLTWRALLLSNLLTCATQHLETEISS